MESTIENSAEREHRFSANEVKDLSVRLVRSEENGGDEFPATLLDFSKKGLRLLIPVSVRFEETVNLYIDCPSAGLEYVGTGQIKHIREDGVQGWQIGCFMNPPLPDSFLAFLAEASNKERRKHPRTLAFGQGRLYKQGETGFSDDHRRGVGAVRNHGAPGRGRCIGLPSAADARVDRRCVAERVPDLIVDRVAVTALAFATVGRTPAEAALLVECRAIGGDPTVGHRDTARLERPASGPGLVHRVVGRLSVRGRGEQDDRRSRDDHGHDGLHEDSKRHTHARARRRGDRVNGQHPASWFS